MAEISLPLPWLNDQEKKKRKIERLKRKKQRLAKQQKRQAERARKKAARQRARYLRRTVWRKYKYLVNVLINAATRAGLVYYSRRYGTPSNPIELMATHKRRNQKIRVLETRYNEHALYLWIDTRHLPHKIQIADLKDEEVLESISTACQYRVEVKHDDRNYRKGFWYVINIDDAMRGIPANIQYRDVWQWILQQEKSKNTYMPPLWFVAGETENARLIYVDLEKAPHMLVGGTSGYGKSNFINNLICTLIQRNTPDQLHIYGFDFKNLIEFWHYKHAPHFKEIIEEPQEAADIFESMIHEMDRRGRIIRNHARNLPEFNKKAARGQIPGVEPMPRILMVIDEMADLMIVDRMLDRKQQIDLTLARILQKGRAVGIHSVLATQTPKAKIIDTLITNNTSYRLGFNCATIQQSIMIIGTANAHELDLVGRGIISKNGREYEIQTPQIHDHEIKTIIEYVKNDQQLDQAQRFDMSNILRYAIKQLNGSLAFRQLWAHYRDITEVTADDIKAYLKAIQETKVKVNNVTYYVMPGAGNRPTQLIKWEDQQETGKDSV